MGFSEWTVMDGPKRRATYFMDLRDGQVVRFDLDGKMWARYRADVRGQELWLVDFEAQ